MTLLDKADIQEQTAHIGPSKVGTVHAPPLGYVAKVEPKRPPAPILYFAYPTGEVLV